MWINDLLTAGVQIAHDITGAGGLLVDVQHAPYVSQDVKGKKTYGTPVTRQALLEQKVRVFKRPEGKDAESKHRLTFLEPVAIGMHDRLTMPDGTTPPIVEIDGLKGRGGVYYAVVWVG